MIQVFDGDLVDSGAEAKKLRRQRVEARLRLRAMRIEQAEERRRMEKFRREYWTNSAMRVLSTTRTGSGYLVHVALTTSTAADYVHVPDTGGSATNTTAP